MDFPSACLRDDLYRVPSLCCSQPVDVETDCFKEVFQTIVNNFLHYPCRAFPLHGYPATDEYSLKTNMFVELNTFSPQSRQRLDVTRPAFLSFLLCHSPLVQKPQIALPPNRHHPCKDTPMLHRHKCKTECSHHRPKLATIQPTRGYRVADSAPGSLWLWSFRKGEQ